VEVSDPLLDDFSDRAARKREEMAWAHADFVKLVKSCKPIAKHKVKRSRPSNRGLKKLFALTTISAHPAYGGDRCVAVFDSFRKAQQVVLKNSGDIHETTYDLAVVEVVFPNGLYRYSMEQYWFRWNKSKKGYEPCTTPYHLRKHRWDQYRIMPASSKNRPTQAEVSCMSTDNLLHNLWTTAVGTPGYDKQKWLELERRLLPSAQNHKLLHDRIAYLEKGLTATGTKP
jgi:hypothetical protein